MENNDYMILSKGPYRVPLLATEKKPLKLAIGPRDYAIPAHLERAWICLLYEEQNRGELVAWMRHAAKRNLSPAYFDSAIEEFEKLHPLTKIDKYDVNDIPTYADPVKGLFLPLPAYECIISARQERELLDMFCKKPYYIAVKDMEDWFRQFCSDYGLDYSKKGKGHEFRWMAASFLQQHGIYCDGLEISEKSRGHRIVTEKPKAIVYQEPKITWVGVQLKLVTLMYIAGYIIVFLIIFILGKNWLCDLIMQYYSK